MGIFMGEPGYEGEVLAYDGIQLVSCLSKEKEKRLTNLRRSCFDILN